jgi:hypothetical protein
MDGLSGYPSRWILLGMLTALRGTWTFFVCVIRVYPVVRNNGIVARELPLGPAR